MSDKTIKLIAVLLSAVSLAAVALSSCGRDSNDKNNDLVFKKNGKLYYKLSEGDEPYELVTDKNGETVVDAQGNMLWKVIDADGKEQTHPVSFPAFINDGREVSCQEFTITLPKGWTNTGNFEIHLRSADSSKRIDYEFYENEEGKVYTGKTFEDDLRTMFASKIEDGTLKITSEKTQVAGRDAVKLILDITGEDGEKTVSESYYVDTDGGCMGFLCLDDKATKPGTFDFKAILDTITYRV